MSKHFYFGAGVTAIVVLYVCEAACMDASRLLLAGFAFVLMLTTALLHEVAEQRREHEAVDNVVKERLAEISFELQLMRDCRMGLMQERKEETVKTVELIGKLLDELAKQECKQKDDVNE